jgi:hypothetical protein
MTSSTTSTEDPPEGKSEVRPVGKPAGKSRPPVQPRMLVGLVGGGLLLVGWGLILHANHWHLTAPVIFLMLGWISVLACAWFLGKAALAATGADPGGAESWSPAGQYEELVAEKKSLLRALKDIEFDHQMGKMSDEDAAQLQRYYRARAIEVLKALDTIEHGGGGTPMERIEREVRARLAVDAKGKKVAEGEGKQ